MTALSLNNYKDIAARYHGTDPIIDLSKYDSRYYTYVGKVVAKQRARAGKGGRHFTPAETRNFEKRVAEWAVEMDMPKVLYPIRVAIVVYDMTQDVSLWELGNRGLVFNAKQDLDNLAKSILDGLNKVAYRDDSQIAALNLSRRYSNKSGFHLQIERAGLSKTELANLRKFLR